jgi:hypothetical protein
MDACCSKQEMEQKNPNSTTVNNNWSIGSDNFKCKSIKTTLNSKNGKFILTDKKWYRNNDNNKSINKQKANKSR